MNLHISVWCILYIPLTFILVGENFCDFDGWYDISRGDFILRLAIKSLVTSSWITLCSADLCNSFVFFLTIEYFVLESPSPSPLTDMRRLHTLWLADFLFTSPRADIVGDWEARADLLYNEASGVSQGLMASAEGDANVRWNLLDRENEIWVLKSA